MRGIELWRETPINGEMWEQFTFYFDSEVECEKFYWKQLYEPGGVFSWYIKIADGKKYLTKGSFEK